MKKMVSLILVVSLLGITGLVFAHGGGSGTRFNDDERNRPGTYYQPGYNQDLNLSEEQESQMEELHDEYYEKREKVWDELEEKQEKLHDLYFNPETSRDQIIETQDEIELLRVQLIDLRTQQILDLRDILTEEQLEQFSEFGFGPGMGFNCGSGLGNMPRVGYQQFMRGHMGGYNSSMHRRGGHMGMGPRW